MSLVIFEDSSYRNFLPLTYTRPVCTLRCGITTLWEKAAALYAVRPTIHVRSYIAAALAEELSAAGAAAVNRFEGESALLLNGRMLLSPQFVRQASPGSEDAAYVCGGGVAAARVSGKRWVELRRMLADGPLPDGWAEGLPQRDTDAVMLQFPWDLVHRNAQQITADFERMNLGGQLMVDAHASAVLDGRDRIHIGEGAEVQPGAILLARGGPVYIGPKAKVMAGAVVQGPAAVGAKSAVKMQAKIYEGTTLGPYCKVGGEVEESILQGYSNKQHDGFLGHAVLGEWINLGADTNNSDLKNNYSTVKVAVDGKQVDSGSLFVGATIGDHSKCGINTMLNTGTVIGVGCNIFGGDFPPKDIASFCWGGSGGFLEHKLAEFLVTVERVMERRDRKLTPAYRAMLTEVHAQTAGHRRNMQQFGA